MDKSEQVLVAMGALVFMVALKEGWLPYLRAWVTSSVGGPGINTLTDAGKAAGNTEISGANSQGVANAWSSQSLQVLGGNPITNTR